MIYGNKALSIIGESSYDNIDENFLLRDNDKDFFVENMSYAIIYDDISLLEYCNEYASPELLQESVGDIVHKAVEFIKNILQKLKDFVSRSINNIKAFFRNKSFRTDSSGKLKPEAKTSTGESAYYFFEAAKEYNSLYDLADEELSVDIVLPEFVDQMFYGKFNIEQYSRSIFYAIADIKDAYDGFYRYKDSKSSTLDRIKSDYDDAKRRIEDQKRQRAPIDQKNQDPKRKLSGKEIEAIIKGSELTEKEVMNNLRKTTDDAQKWINHTMEEINSNKLDAGTDWEEKMSGDSYSKFYEYASNILVQADKEISQLTTEYVAANTKYITTCCKVRKQLESELLKKRNQS